VRWKGNPLRARLLDRRGAGPTVNAALRDYVARVKRLEAAERLAARGAGGEFDQAAAAYEAAKRARRAAFG
jgi:hypothetical protein